MNTEHTLAPSGILPTIRSVDAGRGIGWISGGFSMVFKSPGTWVLVTIALFVISIVVDIITPEAISAAMSMAVTTYLGGLLMLSCRSMERGEDMFTHVKAHASSTPLLVLAAIAAVLYFALMMAFAMLGVGSLVVAVMSPMLALQSAGVGVLGIALLYVLISMALLMSPALVVLRGVPPVEALRLSFMGCLKNISAVLLYTLMMMLVMIVAAIPLGLGLLIAIPAYICSSYIAYKHIFEG